MPGAGPVQTSSRVRIRCNPVHVLQLLVRRVDTCRACVSSSLRFLRSSRPRGPPRFANGRIVHRSTKGRDDGSENSQETLVAVKAWTV